MTDVVSNRQIVSPQRRALPAKSIIGQRRENVDCRADAIAEAIEPFRDDECVTIAAGAIRASFGDVTAKEMGVPDAAYDHQAVLIRAGKLRDTAKSNDRRQSHAGHRS